MDSKREKIIKYLQTQLQQLTGIPVYRSRALPFAENKIPSITVEPIQDSPTANVIGQLDWSLVVMITVFVRGKEPDKIADPFISEIYKKCMNDSDLGGNAMDISPLGFESKIYEGDGYPASFENSFRITYRTSEKDITV